MPARPAHSVATPCMGPAGRRWSGCLRAGHRRRPAAPWIAMEGAAMQRLWVGAVGIAWVCSLAGATAGEPQWRPATPPPPGPSVGVTLGRPMTPVSDNASLGKPALPGSGIALASYPSPANLALPSSVRAQNADEGSGFAADGRPG